MRIDLVGIGAQPDVFQKPHVNHGTKTSSGFASLAVFAAARSSGSGQRHWHHPVLTGGLSRGDMSRLEARVHDQTAVGQPLPKDLPDAPPMAQELPRCDRSTARHPLRHTVVGLSGHLPGIWNALPAR